MARAIGIGDQDFGRVVQDGCFYVDKTAFIREWWENRDIVTLITRPRRFGKALNMRVVTVTMDRYADAFGFTEGKVFAALEEYGMGDKKEKGSADWLGAIGRTGYLLSDEKIGKLIAIPALL